MFYGRLYRRIDELNAELTKLRTECAQRAPAVLQARIEDLEAALEATRRSLRGELSRIHGKLGREQQQTEQATPPSRDQLRSAHLPKPL